MSNFNTVWVNCLKDGYGKGLCAFPSYFHLFLYGVPIFLRLLSLFYYFYSFIKNVQVVMSFTEINNISVVYKRGLMMILK